MFAFPTNIKPSIETLARCSRVLADGDRHEPKEMRNWAMDNCSSLLWYEETDMSDVSSWTGADTWVEVYFTDPRDATMFRLRWS